MADPKKMKEERDAVARRVYRRTTKRGGRTYEEWSPEVRQEIGSGLAVLLDQQRVSQADVEDYLSNSGRADSMVEAANGILLEKIRENYPSWDSTEINEFINQGSENDPQWLRGFLFRSGYSNTSPIIGDHFEKGLGEQDFGSFNPEQEEALKRFYEKNRSELAGTFSAKQEAALSRFYREQNEKKRGMPEGEFPPAESLPSVGEPDYSMPMQEGEHFPPAQSLPPGNADQEKRQAPKPGVPLKKGLNKAPNKYDRNLPKGEKPSVLPDETKKRMKRMREVFGLPSEEGK
tara:strand:+ start:288 stop:1157 length:870 start_codon:yes stop_codon:yes gene_type:complete